MKYVDFCLQAYYTHTSPLLFAQAPCNFTNKTIATISSHGDMAFICPLSLYRVGEITCSTSSMLQ